MYCLKLSTVHKFIVVSRDHAYQMIGFLYEPPGVPTFYNFAWVLVLLRRSGPPYFAQCSGSEFY